MRISDLDESYCNTLQRVIIRKDNSCLDCPKCAENCEDSFYYEAEEYAEIEEAFKYADDALKVEYEKRRETIK